MHEIQNEYSIQKVNVTSTINLFFILLATVFVGDTEDGNSDSGIVLVLSILY